MDFIEKLEELTKIKMEIYDLERLNVEWYDNLTEWKNCIWSWVNKREAYETRENIATLKACVLEFKNESEEKRFRDAGSKPTYHYFSLEKLKSFIDGENYNYVFIEGIGELDKDQVLEFRKWMDEKLK